jgi:hypothetical protein
MKTTYHTQSAPRSSATIVRLLHDLGRRITIRPGTGEPAYSVAPPETGRTPMQRLLAALVLFSVLFGASGAAGTERMDPKRNIGSNISVRAKPTLHMMSGRNAKPDRAIDPSPTFRAEEIVPDICRGCSS